MSVGGSDEDILISRDDNEDKEEHKKTVSISLLSPPKRFRWPLFIATTILGLAALVAVIVAFTVKPLINKSLEDVSLDKHTRLFTISRGTRVVLKSKLGVSIKQALPKAYLGDWLYRIRWEGEAVVTVTNQNETDESAECVNVSWHSFDVRGTLEDCIELGDSHWYGGAEMYRQTWPMEADGHHEMRPFVSSDELNESLNKTFGSVLQPIWLSSDGVAIIVDASVPLHVGFNSTFDGTGGKLCLQSKHNAFAYPHWNDAKPVVLDYVLCTHDDVKSLYQYVASTYWDPPDGIPAVSMMERPLWSMYVQYFRMSVSQVNVLEFANKIIENGFSYSNVEICGKYSTYYGDLEFDDERFPNVSQMTSELERKGFNVTLWVYPFANIDSKAFQYGAAKSFWVTGANIHLNLVSWQNTPEGEGTAILDATNQTARQWFVSKLKHIQSKYNIKSFKFDAGEVNYLPQFYTTSQRLQNPGDFSAYYSSIATAFCPLSQVRVGYFTQHLPVFVSVMRKQPTWGINNGLHSLITSVLTLGVMGYPFVIPDAVGGSTSNTFDSQMSCPSDELFIRWAQATAFMPVMQFSLSPWSSCFNDSSIVTRLAHEAVELHENVSRYIVRLALNSVTTQEPIVRPLWWIAPNDTTAHVVNDQFLLGDNVLVAPVIHEAQRKRDIYIPKGKWCDTRHSNTSPPYNGPKLLANFPAPLNVIPYFVRCSQVQNIFSTK